MAAGTLEKDAAQVTSFTLVWIKIESGEPTGAPLLSLDITLQSARHSAGHEFLFRSKRAHRNDGEPIH